MTRWWSGFAAGLVVAAVAWSVAGAGRTRADIFARVGAGGRYLLDVRLDESALGRAVNIPAATLGEATLTKRSLFIVTDYAFSLSLRTDMTPETRGALRGLEVSVRLPGSPRGTNATRVTAGTAQWEALGAEPLQFRTRTVHWFRIALLAAAFALVMLFGRRSGRTGLTH